MKRLLYLLIASLLILTACNVNNEANVNNAAVENTIVNENNVSEANTSETNTSTEVTDSQETAEAETTSDTEETETTETDEEVTDDRISRDIVPDYYKWDLEKIYTDTDAFLADVELVRSSFELFETYHDTLLDSYENFRDVMKLYEAIRRTTDQIYVFASLQAHTDTNNTDFSDLEDIAAELDSDLNEVTAYFLPTIANADETLLDSYLTEEMVDFKPYVDEILKQKDHILTLEGEALLAQAEILFEMPENIYDAYKYSTDLSKYLPQPNWELFWNGTRDDRQEALDAYYMKSNIGNNLIAEIYESEIKKNTFFANARNYDSALDQALDNDGITRDVYDSIFEVTHDNLDKLHKWIDLKREILGIEDQLYVHDQYSQLIEDPYAFIDFEKGKEVIYQALAPLGQSYIQDVKYGFENRWADVYSTKGKYEGGYQWGTYDTDPFVLLNFNNLMTDVSTAAHEMGHAINFLYTNKNQGYFSAGIPIFSAEIASTTNEALVFEYRIANAESTHEKQQALLNYIELIENTIFTQMIYAEFEKLAYEAYDSGTPINAELFNDLMGDVLTMYYGPNYAVTDTAKMQWSEIPHFYNAFYVYKYATGLSAGLSFADRILSGNQNNVDLYLDYLASGSSEEPLVLLKRAGVDFSDAQPLQNAFDKFEYLVDQFYKTLD